MTPGLDTQAFAADSTVDPVVLIVMFAAFLVGAVGPFALCVLGSIREERAMRRYAAAAAAAGVGVGNPVEPGVVPAAVTLNPVANELDTMDPANDDGQPAGDAAIRRTLRS